MTALLEIEGMLKQSIGLDASSVGLPLIERAVHQRRNACGLKDLSSYVEKVRSSSLELQELIEAVVVSETWFFRDQEAFNALGQFVIQEGLPSLASKKLRLLSIPCATGEEPYSLAMLFDELGVPGECFQIDAVDISEQALVRARKAVYGRNSFRGKSLEFRDRYFEPGTHHEYHLLEPIRQKVLFQQGNLLSPDFFPGSQLFHFIFCRNLLIYLDQSAQDLAIQTLKRLLVPEGVLFVGPAEAALMLNHQLVSAKRSLAFAFRLGPAPCRQVPAGEAPKVPRKIPVVVRREAVKPVARLNEKGPSIAPVSLAPAPPKESDLKQAHRLANEGQLEDAVKKCEAHLKEHRSSTEAFYLLGVLHDAMGSKEKAETCYRKVLYLEPEHYESLMQLSYSAEKGGDTSTARNLRARASRIKERNSHA